MSRDSACNNDNDRDNSHLHTKLRRTFSSPLSAKSKPQRETYEQKEADIDNKDKLTDNSNDNNNSSKNSKSNGRSFHHRLSRTFSNLHMTSPSKHHADNDMIDGESSDTCKQTQTGDNSSNTSAKKDEQQSKDLLKRVRKLYEISKEDVELPLDQLLLQPLMALKRYDGERKEEADSGEWKEPHEHYND